MTWIPNRFMQLAVVAALIGMSLGVFMGMKEDFTLAPAHAHLNLLGWVSMMIYALFYRAFPDAARGWLATTHFWGAVLSLVVMIPALAWMMLGHKEATPIVGVGSMVTLATMVLFAAIVFGATAKKPA
jgi:hypothetical protein